MSSLSKESKATDFASTSTVREGDARTSDVIPLEQAEAFFSERIKQDPRVVYYYLMRALVRLENRDLVKGRTDSDVAIRLDSKNAGAYLIRGKALQQLGDLEAAARDLDRAVELAPDDVQSYLGRAEYYAVRKNHEKALADLNAAIERDPESPGCRVRAAAGEWLDSGKPERAIADFNEAVRLGPKSSSERLSRAIYFEITQRSRKSPRRGQ